MKNRTGAPARIRALKRFALLLLLLPFTAVAGCDAILGGGATVQGTWVLEDGDFRVYLEIASETVTVADGHIDECFELLVFDIVAQTEDTYTLLLQGHDLEFDIIFTLDDDRLSVRQGTETATPEYYERSTQDLSALEVCPTRGGGGDPSITCSELPQISVGESVEGQLSSTDSETDGWYYDLYGLTIGITQQVTIDIMSEQFDTYLLLWDAGGTLVAQNDDGGQGFNSQLSTSLDTGCYRVEVTSFGTGEIGDYTLTVD